MSESDCQPVTDSSKQEDTYFGCEHYKRKCSLVSPCCGKVYICRFCHDEKEDHTLCRQNLTEVKCAVCGNQQPVQQSCNNCGTQFGKYFCSTCKLFDDEEKEQFHCSGCGICRVGGRDKYYHCSICDMCLPNKMEGNHKCLEKVSRANCPICMEDIHTSRIASHIPPCCHFIHRNCYLDLLRTGHYACPVCQASMLDMTKIWQLIDKEIAESPMPDDYKNFCTSILCKDCHKESVILFHVLGLKCVACGSYNTCRTKGTTQVSQPDQIVQVTDDASGSDSLDAIMEEEPSGVSVAGNTEPLINTTPCDSRPIVIDATPYDSHPVAREISQEAN